MTITTMAALGSSFAAGPGLPPFADKRAMRSERNYAHLAAQALGATLVDATISGATTETILTKPQRLGLTKYPPQIEQIDPRLDFDLVTITAGGNDLGYLGSLLKTGLAVRFTHHPSMRPLARWLRKAEPTPVTADQVEKAANGLIRIVEAVAHRAPHARILLVDYFTIIGTGTVATPIAPFSEAELLTFRRTGEQLAEAFQKAARETQAELIRISALSEGHAVDAAEPWVNGLRSGFTPEHLSSCFHPNAVGMQAAARAIVDHVSGG